MIYHQYTLIAVMAFTVIALRSIPFLLFTGKRRVPGWLIYLGNVLTAAAIAMLVIYSLYGNLNYPAVGIKNLPAALISSAITVLLHWFVKNPLLSIAVGTVCYMLFI